eukprot:scaffold380972_cov55-Attheya_sp.AAC.3
MLNVIGPILGGLRDEINANDPKDGHHRIDKAIKVKEERINVGQYFNVECGQGGQANPLIMAVTTRNQD